MRTMKLTAAVVTGILTLSGVGACAKSSDTAATDDFPERGLTMIVPFGAGGSTDIEARLLANGMSDKLGKPVTVINAPGGGTSVGMARVLDEAADGYTIFYQSDGYLADLIARKQVDNTLDDLQPVALLGGEAVGLFARTDAPYSTVQELVAYAKDHPGELTVAGTGATGVMANTLISFAHDAGVEMTYVPTEGGGETVKDVLGDHVDLGIVTASVYDEHEKAGKVRTLAVSAEGDEYPPVPGAPTFNSLGYPDTVFYSNRGAFVKAGTPEAVVDTLADVILEVGESQEWKDYEADNLIVSRPLGPEDFGTYLKDTLPRYEKVASLG